MTVGIIGLGLIGGSMAIDLKRRGFADRIIGVESNSINASAAGKIGLVDEVVSYETCVEEADIVVVAVPVGAAVKMVSDILDRFQTAGAKEKIVIDKPENCIKCGLCELRCPDYAIWLEEEE